MSDIKIIIDGIEIPANTGQYILEAAKESGIYIPTLCNVEGVKPRGSCRICSVLVNGRPMSACTTPVTDGMKIQNNIDKLNDNRKAIVELLFAEGNHFCPGCERSGNCELQALGYRYLMMVPRFDYIFPNRGIEADNPYLMMDNNRCIKCKRCIRGIKDENGKNFFAFAKRGDKVYRVLDKKMSDKMTPEIAQKAMDICPVGSLIRKRKGFDVPIGRRNYDNDAIGSEIEKGGNDNE
ncbi:MAG: 2Fe-2S iron-sulfur cluster-binding protein [Candidatus Cloacimonadota bacterium]|nr:2Fe-2S iron-sulfur cluster-binding protein [Candidatus Cloacimonadota bacterium]